MQNIFLSLGIDLHKDTETRAQKAYQSMLHRMSFHTAFYDSANDATHNKLNDSLSKTCAHHLYDGSFDDFRALTKYNFALQRTPLVVDQYSYFKLHEQVFIEKTKKMGTHQPMRQKFDGYYEIIDLINNSKNLCLQDKLESTQRWCVQNIPFSLPRYLKRNVAKNILSKNAFAKYWNQTIDEILEKRTPVCFDLSRLKLDILKSMGVSEDQMMVMHVKLYDSKHTVLYACNDDNAYILGSNYTAPLQANMYLQCKQPLFACLNGKVIPLIHNKYLNQIQAESAGKISSRPVDLYDEDTIDPEDLPRRVGTKKTSNRLFSFIKKYAATF